MKTIITPRHIRLVSDDGRYVIESKRISLQDGYSREMGATYKGSHWAGVTITKDGKVISGIQVKRGNYQPFIHYGKYGCGLLQHGMNLTKDVILYGAIQTGLFTNALEGIDCNKIERAYVREYWKCRNDQIEKEYEQNT